MIDPPLTRTLFLLRPSAQLQTDAMRVAQATIERSI